VFSLGDVKHTEKRRQVLHQGNFCLATLMEIAMQNFRRTLCSLTSVALLAAPLSQAQAQSQTEVNAACVSYSALPAGIGIVVKLPGDKEWRPVNDTSRLILLRSPEGTTAEVRIFKRIPRTQADLTSSNVLGFTIDLTPTSNPKSCNGGTANYRVLSGADGYTLASAGAPAKRQSPSGAAAVVGTVAALGLLAAIFGGGSSTGTGSTDRNEDQRNRDHMEQNAQSHREAEARAEAQRDAERRSAAEAWERLQRPNSLGW
jgi:hypothetical protein